LQINADGSYTFTPDVNYSGAVPVATYTVSDGALTDTATLTLTVSPNTPPNALNDTASVVEDTPASGNVLANDSDAENDPLSVTGFSIDTNGDGTPENFTAGQTATIAGVGTLQINADGSYTFTPATSYNGPVPTATYTVSDGHGGTASATLTLGPVMPVADLTAGDDSAVTNEDTPLSGSVAGNDSTTSGGALTYSQGSSPAHGTLVFHADGSYTYTPAANYNGPDSFTYTVFDAASGESLTRTVHLTVNPVQDLFANDDSATTDEDTPLSGSVAGNDSTTSGGALTYSQASSPAHGTLVFHADGSYTYTPTADYNGPDSFTYTVFDAAAGESLTRTVHITINPVADIVSDDARTDENKPVTIPVLSNDTFEGSPVVTSVTQGSHGSATINADGTVTYTPDLGWSGQDGFTYTVTSGGATETASVKVTVIANPIPADESRLLHSGLLTQPILPVQVDPALHVLFSVNDVHNEMSLHSGLGIFQADSVTTAELLGAPDTGLTFAAGTLDSPGGLSGHDFSPLSDDNWRALYPSNALYVQHAVRHQPLVTDHALHVQNAVRASQLESAARNARVDAYNSATPGMATLFDPFALGAPLAGAGRTTGAADGEKTTPVRLDTSEASQSALDGKVADARDARFQDQSAREQAAPPQSYAAAGFGSQLQRAAADFRPRMARQAVARVAIR